MKVLRSTILMLAAFFLPVTALPATFQIKSGFDYTAGEVSSSIAKDTMPDSKGNPITDLEISNFSKVANAKLTDGSFRKAYHHQNKPSGNSNKPSSTDRSSGGKSMVNWTGSENNNWNNTQNWENQQLPTAADNVTIPGGLDNYPVISGGNYGDCHDLMVEPGASLTIEHGGSFINTGDIFNDGDIDIMQVIPGNQWHMISIPNNETTATLFMDNYLMYYDASIAYWIDITDPSTELVPDKGYGFYGVEDTATFTYTGTPNYGEMIFPVAVSGELNNQNLLGNPYPSALDWDLVAADQSPIHKAVYCWNPNMGDAGVYEPYLDGLGDCRYILPQQGFFVSAVENGNFTLSGEHRVHINSMKNGQNREMPDHALSLGLYENDKLMDKIFFRFNAEATPGFDGDYDAHKILVNSGPQFLIKAGEDKLSIDQRPICEEVQLGFHSDDEGVYSINLVEESNDLQIIYLHDTKTGTYHNLRENDVMFIWYDYDDENRFKLYFGAPIDNFSSTATSICEQEFVIFFADTSNAFADSVRWYFEGGTPEISNVLQPTIDYNTPGNFDVQLMAWFNGMSSEVIMEDYVEVNPLPIKPGVPAGSQNICHNQQMSDYSTNNTSSIWSLEPTNAGTISYTDSICAVSWNESFFGEAELRVKIFNGCGEGEFSEPLIIQRMEPSGVDFSASQTLLVEKPYTIAFTNLTPNVEDYNFLWDFGNGEISTLPEPEYTYPKSGEYSVTLTATHQTEDCVDSIYKEEYIFCSGVGIDSPDHKGFSYQFDRKNQVLNINFTQQPGNAKMIIFDVQGNICSKAEIKSMKTSISMGKFKPGFYIFSIFGEKTHWSGKFISKL